MKLRAAVILLLAAFAAQLLWFAGTNGQTYDEGVTLASGLRILDTHVDDINLEHPPLAKVLVALPVRLFAAPKLDVAAWAARRESGFALGQDVLYAGGVDHQQLLWLGRAPVMVLALLLVALIGWFAHRLWGPRAGLLALALAAFDPNLVAHGALMGLDLPIAFFFTATLFAVHEFVVTRRVHWIALAGLFGGLTLATKHSGPLLVAVAIAALFFRALEHGELPAWWDPERVVESRSRALAHAAGNAFLVGGVALLVVRLIVGSGGFAPYLAGINAQLAHQSHGHPAFLLGEILRTGWRSYFPLAILMKAPPLTLLLAAVSLARFKRDGLALVVLPLACLFVSLLFARINIGVRYALPLMPLLIIVAARVATWSVPHWVFALGLAQHVIAAIRIAPHDLAFFSDAVGGPSRGARLLADSNLDWGQDVSTLGRWLAKQEPPRRLYLSYFGTADPRAYGVRYYPAPSSCAHLAKWRRESEPKAGRELLAVSAMNQQGVFFPDPKAYAWLEGRTPIAVLGHSIAVYDITDDVSAHRALLALYERYGPRELVAEERARVEGIP